MYQVKHSCQAHDNNFEVKLFYFYNQQFLCLSLLYMWTKVIYTNIYVCINKNLTHIIKIRFFLTELTEHNMSWKNKQPYSKTRSHFTRDFPKDYTSRLRPWQRRRRHSFLIEYKHGIYMLSLTFTFLCQLLVNAFSISIVIKYYWCSIPNVWKRLLDLHVFLRLKTNGNFEKI